MVLDIVTWDGFDFGFATSGDDVIIMADLPSEQLDRLQSSPLADVIYLVDGDNYLENDDVGRWLLGGPGSDTIVGGAENDSISGGSGNDSLIGGPGHDIFWGDEGLDTLTGGDGSDWFILADSPANRDVITDFTGGQDKIFVLGDVSLDDIHIQNPLTGPSLILQDGVPLAVMLDRSGLLSEGDLLNNEVLASTRNFIISINQVLLEDPENALLYNARGEAFSYLGRHSEAIDDFTMALSLDPENASLYYANRGRSFSLSGDREQALADYNQAIEANPENAQAFAGRAGVHWGLNEPELALRDYTEAIRLQPDADWIYFNRGVAYAQLEQYDEAIADFTTAIDLNPDDVQPYLYRGITYQETGNIRAAVEDFERVIELDENYADAHYALGVTYRQSFNLRASRASFEEAARLYEIQGNDQGLLNVAQEMIL
jgi:tetratricopeptide (TPR) repeat protein